MDSEILEKKDNIVSLNNLKLTKQDHEPFQLKNIATLIFNNVDSSGYFMLPKTVKTLILNDFYGLFYDIDTIENLQVTKYIGSKLILGKKIKKYEGKIDYINNQYPNGIKSIIFHDNYQFTNFPKLPKSVEELIIYGKYDITEQMNINNRIQKLEIHNLTSCYTVKEPLKFRKCKLLKSLKLIIDGNKFDSFCDNFLNTFPNAENIEMEWKYESPNDKKITLKLSGLPISIKKIKLINIDYENINYLGEINKE